MEHWTLPSWLPPDAVLPLAILLAALVIALVLILRRPAPDPLAGMVLGQLSALAAAQERQAERVASLEGDIADRVNSVVMDQTRVLNTAVQEQISRIAAQEAAPLKLGKVISGYPPAPGQALFVEHLPQPRNVARLARDNAHQCGNRRRGERGQQTLAKHGQ